MAALIEFVQVVLCWGSTRPPARRAGHDQCQPFDPDACHPFHCQCSVNQFDYVVCVCVCVCETALPAILFTVSVQSFSQSDYVVCVCPHFLPSTLLTVFIHSFQSAYVVCVCMCMHVCV